LLFEEGGTRDEVKADKQLEHREGEITSTAKIFSGQMLEGKRFMKKAAPTLL
jgi:hypothetical protein